MHGAAWDMPQEAGIHIPVATAWMIIVMQRKVSITLPVITRELYVSFRWKKCLKEWIVFNRKLNLAAEFYTNVKLIPFKIYFNIYSVVKVSYIFENTEPFESFQKIYSVAQCGTTRRCNDPRAILDFVNSII